MRINNAIEMYNLLNTFGLVDKNSKTKEFSNCILSIQNCACTSRNDKLKIQQHCNKLYVELVHWVTSNMKLDFLSRITERQISFYSDTGKLLMIISR